MRPASRRADREFLFFGESCPERSAISLELLDRFGADVPIMAFRKSHPGNSETKKSRRGE
jgi:hypothetical protein